MDLSGTPAVRSSPRARQLLAELATEHAQLVVLLDDSGCCGPGNVFVQVEPPRPGYRRAGVVGDVPVYIAPSFLRDADVSQISLDVRPAPLDDSLSLETARGVRLTVVFQPAAEPGSTTPVVSR
jgi:uncharacterized protein (DUF779 family)